ncbi:hypothetical protein V8E53_005898 [Lactarius tabidus]
MGNCFSTIRSCCTSCWSTMGDCCTSCCSTIGGCCSRATGEVTSQEPPQLVVDSRTRSSQRGDMKSGGNAGASSAHIGGATMQELPQQFVESRIRSFKKSDINSGGNAVTGSQHKSGHRGEGATQEQPRPVEESHRRSFQNGDINSGGNAGTGSSHREASQEQPQPDMKSPTPSFQKSSINSGEKAGASSESGHRGEGTSQDHSQPVEESPIHSSKKSDIDSGGNAGTGSRHREASQEQPEPVVEPPTPSSQNSNLYSGEKASVSSESGHRGEEALQEQALQPQPVVEPPTPSSQNSEINLGDNAGASLGHRGFKRAHSNSSNMTTNPTGSNGTLTSELRRLLPEHFKFRILVVGKIGSGKSSLIKAVFKVDMTLCAGNKAAPETTSGTTDIDVGFHPEDNRYLIVHELSGLETRAGSPQNLEIILDFMKRRTDPSLKVSERLHAVWICVPASDAILGRLGVGVENILGMRTVPVVLVFTKFDVVVSQVLLDVAGGNAQRHELARAKAKATCEDSCRDVFHKAPSDVPAGVVSANPSFVDLIDSLIETTDGFITNAPTRAAQSGVQEAKQRVGAVPLAWSAALRVSHEIIIKTTIAIGRSRELPTRCIRVYFNIVVVLSGYWRTLWDSRHFAGQTLKDCVDIIHFDIVEIWNLNDEDRYLSGNIFKVKMSHLVKDLAVSFNNTNKKSAGSASAMSSSSPAGTGNRFAKWVHYEYEGSRENVCCVMGYIVDLTVILDGIFRAATGGITLQNRAESILDDFWARRRHRIHSDIRNIVEGTYPLQSQPTTEKDIFLERVDDLIKQNCVPLSVSGSHRGSEFSGISRST